MSNVVQHQTAVWQELKHWCDKEQSHAEQARACWPEIAARMARLRRDYPSNEDFGAALVLHGIEYGKDDRAAFIWMGTLTPAAFEDALARSARRSPQHFRREVESWGDEYFAPFSSRDENAASAPPCESIAIPVPPETQQSAPELVSAQQESAAPDRQPDAIDRRQVLVQKLPEQEARVLLAHYSDKVTRQMLAKLPRKVATELVSMIKSGRLGTSNDSTMKKVSARLLVPELPWEWTRGRTCEPTDTRAVKSIMADAERFIAMRDAGCRNKAQCDQWWVEHVTRRKAIDVTIAAPAPAAGEGAQIIVHGNIIWPRPAYVADADKYERSAAVAMFHLWQDLNRALSVGEKSHVGRGRLIANLAQWVERGASKEAGVMLKEMALAQQTDPDGRKECSRLTYVNGDKV